MLTPASEYGPIDTTRRILEFRQTNLRVVGVERLAFIQILPRRRRINGS